MRCAEKKGEGLVRRMHVHTIACAKGILVICTDGGAGKFNGFRRYDRLDSKALREELVRKVGCVGLSTRYDRRYDRGWRGEIWCVLSDRSFYSATGT